MTTKSVLRGGCGFSTADGCRSADRYWVSPSYRISYLGFRVLKEKKIEYRVNRGGSWVSTAVYCRSAFRVRDSPSDRSLNLGFRVLKESKDDN
tara:strand:+ start:5275 stop:5553 length:279 start_codon:yes stop_codon:yes gene_type:complete